MLPVLDELESIDSSVSIKGQINIIEKYLKSGILENKNKKRKRREEEELAKSEDIFKTIFQNINNAKTL